jgi:hypothetical protein
MNVAVAGGGGPDHRTSASARKERPCGVADLIHFRFNFWPA